MKSSGGASSAAPKRRPAKPQPDADALFARNARAFARAEPELWKLLQSIAPVSALAVENGRADNIRIGTGELYPVPASKWTERELGGFFEDPDRIGFKNPDHCNISEISFRLLRDLRNHSVAKLTSDSFAPLPVVDVGYTFVFGIGLGLHIHEVVRRTPARRFVLIEPVAEFLLHSLRTADWTAIFRTAKAQGKTLHFVLLRNPADITAAIGDLVRAGGNTFLDGSYYCAHYYSWALAESYKRLKETIKHYYVTSGFLEDEVEMVTNTYQNYKSWAFRLLEGKPHLEQTFPVFVIGSGPSLDKDLPYIRQWRERAIVVSCGTGLRVLLKNGIRPDLHVELERDERVLTVLKQVDQEFGLKGITLIASCTIWPEVSALFEKRWLFLRAMLSPATIMRGDAQPLHYADPLVSNSGFSAMARLGFRNIFLFGVDSGQKQDGLHHSKDSAYFIKENVVLEQECRNRWDRVVPGNFGGMVKTFWAFDLGRRMLGEAQARYQVNLFNCSDGAQIPGAEPKAGAALDFAAVTPNRADVLARVERQMRAFAPGQLLDTLDPGHWIDQSAAFKDAFRALMADLKRDETSFWDIELKLVQFSNDNDFRGYYAMAGGSMAGMYRLGAFFGTRIRDKAARMDFLAFFLDRFEERCLEMADRVRELMEAVRAGTVTYPYSAAACLPPAALVA